LRKRFPVLCRKAFPKSAFRFRISIIIAKFAPERGAILLRAEIIP
jgi:hypothetical protein